MEIAQHANRGQEQARRATSLEGEAAAHRSTELHVDYGAQGLVGRAGGALLCAVVHSIRGCFLWGWPFTSSAVEVTTDW